MVDWVLENKEWLFSGVGVTLVILIVQLLRRKTVPPPSVQQQHGGSGSQNLQAGRDVNITLHVPDSAAGEHESEDMWVDLSYAEDAGIAKRLREAGYTLGWIGANREARKVNLEGWEVVIEQLDDGRRVRYKIRDHSVGGYLVLMKKR